MCIRDSSNSEQSHKQFQPQQQQQQFKNKPIFQRFNQSKVLAITETNADEEQQKNV